MRGLLVLIWIILLTTVSISAYSFAEDQSEEVTGKIVSSYDNATGATMYQYKYDLAPEVIQGFYALADTFVEPVVFVYEDGSVQLFMSAARIRKQKWFFFDSATLVLGLKDDKTMRISFGCEKTDADILYAYEYSEVMDDGKVIETVMVQLSPSPFGEKELNAIKNAKTMELVLYGRQAPLVLKSGTGEWQAFFDTDVWKKMVTKYKELLKTKGQ